MISKKVSYLVGLLILTNLIGGQANAQTAPSQPSSGAQIVLATAAKMTKAPKVSKTYPAQNTFLGPTGIVQFTPANISGYRLIEKEIGVCDPSQECYTARVNGQYFSSGTVSVRILDDYTYYVHTEEDGAFYIAGKYYYSKTLAQGQSCATQPQSCIAVPIRGDFSMLKRFSSKVSLSILPKTPEILAELHANSRMGLDCGYYFSSSKSIRCGVDPTAWLGFSYDGNPDHWDRLWLTGNINVTIIEHYGSSLNKTLKLTKTVPINTYQRFFTVANKPWASFASRPYLVAIGPFNQANGPENAGYTWAADRLEIGYVQGQ